MKIYLPNYTSNNCIVVRDKDTIRVYETTPQQNNNYYNYTDYYINSHYLTNTGSQQFNQYSTIPTCRNQNEFTKEVFYRNDFADILLIFGIMCIFIFLIPTKIIMRLFKRVRL